MVQLSMELWKAGQSSSLGGRGREGGECGGALEAEEGRFL